MSYTYHSGYEQPDETVSTKAAQAVGGCAIGILVLDLRYPLFPGNVANATTWNFPVLYKVLEGAGPEILNADPMIKDMVIESGRELERQGVRAIVGSCGYLGYYQKESAAALDTPIFLSSLLQAPLVIGALKPDQKLGVICAVKESLNPLILDMCGVHDHSRIVIAGAQNLPEFKHIITCSGSFNSRKLERELVQLAKDLVHKNPEIGAILLECSDMPPYAHTIQNALRLPVFDFTTLINWVYSSVVRRPFDGFV